MTIRSFFISIHIIPHNAVFSRVSAWRAEHFKLKYTRQFNKQEFSRLLLSRSRPDIWRMDNAFLFPVDSTEFSFNAFIWIAIYPLDIVIHSLNNRVQTFRRVAYFDKGFDWLFCLLYFLTGIMKTIQTCRTRRSCFITRYCLTST